MENGKVDYGKELGQLNQGSDSWKPTVGLHKIVVLEEPTHTEYLDKGTNEKTPQIKMMIEVNGKHLLWYITKGITTRSVYGQLMVVGKERGKLAGESLTIMVKEAKEGDKVRKDYTVAEALEIMQKKV